MAAANDEEQKFSKKFLFVSNYGDSVDLAWQLKKEGNEVKIYIDDEDQKEVGDGFVDKIDEWKPSVEWADVIVFDDVGYGKVADQFRKKGKLVVGGSEYTDRLEMDREFGQEEMKNVGMVVLSHWDFDDFSAAIDFLKKNPGRYVFKPSGKDIVWDVKNLLFIGQEEDGKDLIDVLEHNKKVWSRKIKQFQLQKFASGVEIAVGAFFNGTDFIVPVNINFEHKKLFPGDIGPSTGEMGTLMFWSSPNNLFRATLERMREKIKASGYVGYIDINCIANSRGIYPLEFTSRFGYPTLSIQMEGVLSPWGPFLHSIAKGEPFEFKTKNGFQVGVVIAVPPFPYDDDMLFKVYKDSSLLFKKPSVEGVHLGEVKLVEGDWRLAGGIGYVLVMTGSNSTVEGARRNCYRRVDNIILQNMFYRTDIGEKWYYQSDKLQTWGIL